MSITIEQAEADLVRQMKGDSPYVLAHIFIHSNADTGKPAEISCFEIIGKTHEVYIDELNSRTHMKDKAETLYELSGKLDDSAWFLCELCCEDATDPPEHYAEFVKEVRV